MREISKNTTVYLTAECRAIVKRALKGNGKTFSAYIRDLIKEESDTTNRLILSEIKKIKKQINP